MNPRPAHEPDGSLGQAQRLLDDRSQNTTALGCPGCPDFEVCGGLHVDAGLYDCEGLCTCQDPSVCDTVCRNKPAEFFERFQEVSGFGFAGVAHQPPTGLPDLPEVVPVISHKYRRREIVPLAAACVPLYELFHLGTGQPLVRTREELEQRFLIPRDAQVIVTGVDRDTKLEAWWSFEDRQVLLETLRCLGICAVTAPNFSLFTDLPRQDNLHSMKRIALAWAELAAAGLCAAPHLNARTDRDYARWAEFLIDHPEIVVVAFEFGTGAGYAGRIGWHVERLRRLAARVGRPLTLLLRGGVHVLPELRSAFARVVFLDTEAFFRTMKRRRAEFTATGRLRWPAVQTAKGEPLDGLLRHNIETVRTYLAGPHRPAAKRRSAPRRAAKHADRQTDQLSLVPHLELALQAGTVPT